MKAIVLQQYGGPEVLRWEDREPARLAPGQVRVQVAYAGVNYLDIYQRLGLYPVPIPGALGMEGSGTVTETGPGVGDFAAGDQVVWLGTAPGSYAEELIIDAARLLTLPDGFTLQQGAALPMQGITAQYLLREYAHIGPGSTVLIHAAAGGVGLLLVQWAKHLGATVIGTVSSEAKQQLIEQAGADHAIRYTEHDFVAAALDLTGGKGVDVVIDGVGKDTFAKSQQAAGVHGWVIAYGFASGRPDVLVTAAFQQKALRIAAGDVYTYMRTRAEYQQRFADAVSGVREGWLKLHYGPEMPLAQAAEAHRQLESRATTGKLLLRAR